MNKNFHEYIYHDDNYRVSCIIASKFDDASMVIKDIADNIGFDGIIVGDIQNAGYFEEIAHLIIQVAIKCDKGTNNAFVYLSS